MRILVTGTIAYDLLLTHDGSFTDALDPEGFEELSVMYLAQHFARHHGGTGANIAWNLKLLGNDPLLVSTVGDDGGSYQVLLRDRGIDTMFVEQLQEHATSTAIMGTDSYERQITFFHPGADAHGQWPEQLSSYREEIAYAIVSPRDAGLMMEAVQWCKHWKVPYVFDPGQQVNALSDDELRRGMEDSAATITNAYEWDLLSHRLNLTEENAAAYTPLLVVTHGENGVTFFDAEGGETVSPCIPDGVVNPTGAGDGLRAGLLTGLASGWHVRDGLRLGAALASFVVESEGTLPDRLDMGMLGARYERAYGEPLTRIEQH